MIKRLVVTGYKQHELGIFDDKNPGVRFIKKALENRFRALIDEELEWIIVSGQLGVETWAAEVAIELKEEFPQLQLALLTPFLEQENRWNETNQERYKEIQRRADFHRSLTNRPYEAPWQFIEKNKFFLRNSDGILIVYDEETDGSPKFIKKEADHYAEKADYQVMLITADDLRVVTEEEQYDSWE
ncbi:SLOG family protein [Planococcus beigongshangi]|uniref:SLOG family protein n=1 Tax=Planococcus beigongshangi TaxID=2782536 RepID=UPI00193C647B|nr:DUF1273 domain-containing protein [Planococcus beigongshangi]